MDWFGWIHEKDVQWAISATATGLLGFFAWRVARQQALTAKAKLKLDLFDRRYAVFEAAQDFATDAMLSPGAQAALNFELATKQAAFLFGRDVQDHMEMLQDRHRRLWKLRQRQADIELVDDDPSFAKDVAAHTKARDELEHWFAEQPVGGNTKVFARYLNFNAWS